MDGLMEDFWIDEPGNSETVGDTCISTAYPIQRTTPNYAQEIFRYDAISGLTSDDYANCGFYDWYDPSLMPLEHMMGGPSVPPSHNTGCIRQSEMLGPRTATNPRNSLMSPRTQFDPPCDPLFHHPQWDISGSRETVREQRPYPGTRSRTFLKQQTTHSQNANSNTKLELQSPTAGTENDSIVSSPQTKPPAKKLACPFFLRDPQHPLKLSCNSNGFPDISRLKEHLNRVHEVSFTNRMKARSNVDKWNAIWKHLFPEDSEESIPSPYWTDRDTLRKQQNLQAIEIFGDFILKDLCDHFNSASYATPQTLRSRLQETFLAFKQSEGVDILPATTTEEDAKAMTSTPERAPHVSCMGIRPTGAERARSRQITGEDPILSTSPYQFWSGASLDADGF
ncbi:uncharacterized protein K452DRAFT_361331 [Aplosporella prunicola CBS 121167]|uniref:Uncharacterized protein n=1 Tax=Aplosporella prunicola CBS 121167 TaxID=1176127 RepID=A0A6A6B642_9PEZI|nr:uncharacterized protein K452DRAFT_361331 [Aplosporella prunicola CBS 121167]KAF2138251.1 hypothetical protein K452DRAFT_361331 [Aplosporella prunicola CBS 121167]